MSAHRRPYLGALILIILGILFLLDNLGVANFGEMISTYWPIILILIGLRMFLRYGRHTSDTTDAPNISMGSATTLESSVSTVHNSNTFGDIDLKFSSKEFRGGSISNTFGDMNIDLADIQLAEGEQTLKLDGVFGDLHVLVPKDIEINVSTHSVFGDVRALGTVKTGFGQQISYSTPNYPGATKKLRIVSNQVFGDVRIW